MAPNLSTLGRHKSLSQSALSAVLKELKEGGELPSVVSRQSIKRARDAEVSLNTPLGPLLVARTVTLPAVKRTKKQKAMPECQVTFTMANPLAVLHNACQKYAGFSNMLHKVLQAHKPTSTQPLRIVTYSDGITPGNVLAHRNERKCQVVYWSLAELGAEALSSEQNWFLLAVVRADHVKRLPAKMSEFYKMCLELFYAPIDIRRGVQLVVGGERRMLFAELGIMLGDCDAIREVFDMKGFAGSVPCPLCQNLVKDHSLFAQYDASDTLVPMTCVNLQALVAHTDDSILETLQLMATERSRVSQQRAKLIEQLFGFNYNAAGLLLSPALAIKPASSLMWDWMHCYMAGGIWNHEVALLLTKLHACGYTQGAIAEELDLFRWPQAISSRSVTGVKAFAKEQASDTFKCTASEALSLYNPLLHLLLEHFGVDERLKPAAEAIQSYINLCKVVDLLLGSKKQRTRASTLQNAIVEHLTFYIHVYGLESFLPKHHYTLHLAEMLSSHRLLLSCWVHERKHREVKAHAGMHTNTRASWERSCLIDALHSSFHSLSEVPAQPSQSGLCKPFIVPSLPVAGHLQLAVGVVADVEVSRSALWAPGCTAFVDDVILCQVDGAKKVLGEVKFFARVGQALVVCFKECVPHGKNVFEVNGPVRLLDLSSILDTCVFAPRGNDIAVVKSPLA